MSDKPRPQPPAKPAAKSGAKAKPDESLDFLRPAQAAGELGRLAHYRVLKVLGRGGMGTVFLAEDPRLNRLIALKVMLPSMAKKATACERFKREARATAKIEHDHIVTIFEVNEDRGVPYLAMQLLKGMSLDDWLKAGKTLNIPQVMRIGKEIAKGLASAHSFHLIHRDIKPSNIWLDATNKGRVKILDFGLVRSTNEDTGLTQDGMILGTLSYMSPEQARGHVVDERSDLFSLGCVLYRLCAGKPPFTGKDPTSMLIAITSAEPQPIAELNPAVPASLARLIHRLLAKKPEERLATALEVVQAIQSIEREWIANMRTTVTPALKDSSVSADRSAATAKDDVDPALEDSAITDLELLPTQIPGITQAPPNRRWILAALGGALFVVVSLMCCLGWMVATDQGEVTLIARGAEAKALVETSGVSVVDRHKKTHTLKGGTQQLPAGDYDVNIIGLPDGMQVEPNSFTLARGKTQELTIWYVPQRPDLERVTTANAKTLQEAWAKHLEREVIDINTIGMGMVLIPAGEFTMGSSKEAMMTLFFESKKPERLFLPFDYVKLVVAEAPPHNVRITKPFSLGMHEVTVDQYAQFVAAMHYTTEVEKGGRGSSRADNGRETVRKPEYHWKDPGVAQTKSHPVCNVSWADAEAFCRWLSTKEKKRYRLPTEAEWEYACRAGSTTLWHLGDNLKEAGVSMWCFVPKASIAGVGAHEVGSKKKPNGFGLHDMHGNVEEMCADRWSPFYYEKSPIDDPQGPVVDSGRGKVARGGSFLEVPFACRSAFRNARDPTLGYVQVGFRVVCELP